MNIKMFALVAVIALASSAYAMSNLAQPVMAKCFSTQSKDRTSTIMVCGGDDHTAVDGFKKDCKESVDNKETRCSSSQTGNGVFDKNP